MNPIEIWFAVESIGGRLGTVGDKLRMLLPSHCSPELKSEIRRNKASLIELLQLNFLTVRSDVLGTVLWAPDAQTKTALIANGADPGSVYTPDELRVLVNHRITAEELPQIHEAKRQFLGRIRQGREPD